MKKQLEEADEQGYKWEGVKQLKNKLTLRFTKFKEKEGNRKPYTCMLKKPPSTWTPNNGKTRQNSDLQTR